MEYPNDPFHICAPSSFIISCEPILPDSEPWCNSVGADPWTAVSQSHDDKERHSELLKRQRDFRSGQMREVDKKRDQAYRFQRDVQLPWPQMA